ncbi:MAG: hypothetical protein H6600_06670 [Flavobacteriales bacterium]|nr:hypothetical protein [Flavobacteriales bacterium]
MKLLDKIEQQIALWLIASLTLGLAPFVPEPHIVGKLRWVAGGAVGMQPMDWFDLIMHGTPFLLLIIAGLWKLKKVLAKK